MNPPSTAEFISLVDKARHKRRALNRQKNQSAKRELTRELRDLESRVDRMLDILIAPSLPLEPTALPTGMLDESERQLVLLALAVLSLHRPGWKHALRSVSNHFAGEGLFEDFRTANEDLYKPDPYPMPEVVKL